jgi:hypothetical protein
MQDGGPTDCLLWKKISKNYNDSVELLDSQMRGLLVIERAARRVSKEVYTLQHTATYCHILPHTAAHRIILHLTSSTLLAHAAID